MPTPASSSAETTRVTRLRSLAARLEAEAQVAEGAALASVARALVTVLEQIDELAPPVPQKGTPLDELAKRRGGRPAAAAGRSGAAG